MAKPEKDTTKHIKDVLANTKDIMMSDASMTTLLDFERVLAELDLYAFANWKDGELIEGPVNEKYFVTCKFMWPEELMPDPRGGKRLLGYDCTVTYQKTKFKTTVTVEKPEDFEDGTKMPKMATSPVWVVSITMPRKLLSDIKQSVMDIETDAFNADEIEFAYDTGEDETEGQQEGQEGGQEAEYQVDVPEELPK